jgi:hypothetical protein
MAEKTHPPGMSDGYAGVERLTVRGDIVLAACWAHTQRKFYDVHQATASPIAVEAGHPMNRIDDLLPWNWKASSVET